MKFSSCIFWMLSICHLSGFYSLYAQEIAAQDSTRYFYRPEIKYGSLGVMNPLTIVMQNGLEMLPFHNSPQLSQFPYAFSAKRMASEFFNPIDKIREYGFREFINDEFFPFDLENANGSVVPNVMLHFLGGGYVYAWSEEYYRYHGYRYPKTAAVATVYLKNLINELSETPHYPLTRVDLIADLYFWDLLAIVAFNQNSVKRFFSEEIGLYNWGTMPVLDITTRMRNTNAYYAFRPVRPSWKINPVAIAGLGFLGGVSVKSKNGLSYSLTAGVLSHSVVPGSAFSNEAPELKVKPATAFFIDRNNSVLFNVIYKIGSGGSVRTNLYPGVLGGMFKNAGIYAEAGSAVHAGLVWRIPGFGFGF